MKLAKSLLVVAFATVAVAPAFSLTLLTSRAQVMENDFIEWSQFGPAFTNVPNPSLGLTNLGTAFAVSAPTQSLEVRTQSTGGWAGNFTPGDSVLYVQGGDKLSINFGTTQRAVGMNIQADFFGAFRATMTAFNALNMNLGTVVVSGNSTFDADGSAVFIGAESLLVDIARVDLEVSSAFGSGMGVNYVSLSNCAVPEPGSIAAIAVGLAAMLRRRRK